CYLVGLLNAIHTLTQSSAAPQALAEEACHIELERLRKPIGKQDQYMAAFGGLTALEISTAGQVRVSHICLPSEILETLENNILLFYTGSVRDSGAILARQDSAARQRSSIVLGSLTEIRDIGLEIRDSIVRGDLHRFGQLLDAHWQAKKRLSDRVTNPQIDVWYQIARRNGAIGGKISGAGGGGFLMVYCEQNKARLREAMRRAGLRELSFRFEFEGSKVVFDM